MSTTAKFVLQSITTFSGNTKKYNFYAICDNKTPENQKFQKYTPSGLIEICVDNPNVSFEIGKSYYVTFDEAE